MSSESELRAALEHIREVASGERQVANDDTEGMAYIDKYACAVLASPPASEGGDAKSIAEDWLNEHKHTWSAHDLFSLTRLLAARAGVTR